MKYTIKLKDKLYKAELQIHKDNKFSITIDQMEYQVWAKKLKNNLWLIRVGDKPFNVVVLEQRGYYECIIENENYEVKLGKEGANSYNLQHEEIKRGSERITAVMPGKVIEILVKPGDTIAQSQPILVLEAMKMENEIRSPRAGIVKSINVNKGDAVETGALLAEIE